MGAGSERGRVPGFFTHVSGLAGAGVGRKPGPGRRRAPGRSVAEALQPEAVRHRGSPGLRFQGAGALWGGPHGVLRRVGIRPAGTSLGVVPPGQPGSGCFGGGDVGWGCSSHWDLGRGLPGGCWGSKKRSRILGRGGWVRALGKGLARCPRWWRRHQPCVPVAAVAAPCGEQIPRERIPQEQIHREVQVRGREGQPGREQRAQGVPGRLPQSEDKAHLGT